MDDRAVETVQAVLAETRWLPVPCPTEYRPALARDILYALEKAGLEVVDAERFRVAKKSFTDLTEAWAELRMDTEKDQALHDRLVAASRVGAELLKVTAPQEQP